MSGPQVFLTNHATEQLAQRFGIISESDRQELAKLIGGVEGRDWVPTGIGSVASMDNPSHGRTVSFRHTEILAVTCYGNNGALVVKTVLLPGMRYLSTGAVSRSNSNIALLEQQNTLFHHENKQLKEQLKEARESVDFWKTKHGELVLELEQTKALVTAWELLRDFFSKAGEK